uniref:NME/NM23 family member 8 n=1 Tax=Gopherus evgoodei TaxID=1825980 RepID=A0A8C4W1D9_9SAUR
HTKTLGILGPSVIMILTKENAVEEWRQLMGPTDPDVAKESSPDSLRAQFAQDIFDRLWYCSPFLAPSAPSRLPVNLGGSSAAWH